MADKDKPDNLIPFKGVNKEDDSTKIAKELMSVMAQNGSLPSLSGAARNKAVIWLKKLYGIHPYTNDSRKGSLALAMEIENKYGLPPDQLRVLLLGEVEVVTQAVAVVAEVTETVVPSEEESELIEGLVDEAISLRALYNDADKRLKEIRDVIEPFMYKYGIDLLEGTKGGQIDRTPMRRPPMNACFTSYDPDLTIEALKSIGVKPSVVKEVTEVRVNAEKLEAHITLRNIDPAIRELKLGTDYMTYRIKTAEK